MPRLPLTDLHLDGSEGSSYCPFSVDDGCSLSSRQLGPTNLWRPWSSVKILTFTYSPQPSIDRDEFARIPNNFPVLEELRLDFGLLESSEIVVFLLKWNKEKDDLATRIPTLQVILLSIPTNFNVPNTTKVSMWTQGWYRVHKKNNKVIVRVDSSCRPTGTIWRRYVGNKWGRYISRC